MRARRVAGAVGLCCALLAGGARAGTPDPAGAIVALVDSSLAATGDVLGGIGLCSAAALGGVGDLVEAVDGNRYTHRFLRGVASHAVHRTALGISQASTGALEGLRARDVERLPEPPEAYLEAAYGAGRFATLADGLGALWLAVGDAAAGPARLALRSVGAEETAERLERSRERASVRWIGPPPLPPVE